MWGVNSPDVESKQPRYGSIETTFLAERIVNQYRTEKEKNVYSFSYLDTWVYFSNVHSLTKKYIIIIHFTLLRLAIKSNVS